MKPAHALFLGLASFGAAPLAAATVNYEKELLPLLKDNCLACHNKTTTKAGLNMETPELMLKGGDSGPALVPGKSAESLIVLASLHQNDMEMPPKNNKSGAEDLTPAELAVLKTWIDEGAKSSVPQERQVVVHTPGSGGNPIYAVALTRDGRFAACGRANRIYLHDLRTRQFLTQVGDAKGAHQAMVQALAFSPDGRRLASASFREVKIWRQEETPAGVRPADAARAFEVTAAAPDGKQLFVADRQGVLFVLEGTTSAKPPRKLAEASKSGVQSLALSPDGAKVAVCGKNGSVSVWDAATGAPLGAIPGASPAPAPAPMALPIAWSSDGKTLFTAGADKVIRGWTLPVPPQTALQPAAELKGTPAAITLLAAGAAPDQILAAGGDGRVRVWSLSQAKVLRELAVPGALALSLSRDGRTLATLGTDGAVRLWEVESGKPAGELRGTLEQDRQAALLNWTAARQTLEQEFQKSEIARIEAQNKSLEDLLTKAAETIVSIKKSLPEKQKAVKPAEEARIAARKTLDDLTTALAAKPDAALEKQRDDAEEKFSKAMEAELSAAAALKAAEDNIQDALNDEKRITEVKAKNATDLASTHAAVAAAQKQQEEAAAGLLALKKAAAAPGAKGLAVAFSADGQKAAALFADGSLRVWAVATGILLEETKGAAMASATLQARADGGFLACAGDGAIIHTAGSPRWVLERVLQNTKGHMLFADRVNAVRFSPDGKILATGGGEPSRTGDVALFDMASGKLLRAFPELHDDAVLSLDFSPDGKLLASGAADKIAKVTDLATGRRVNLFEGHTHYVMGVAFRADGRVLATAGADGIVTTWDMILGERKKKIPGWTREVTSLEFIGATGQLVTSAGDNLVRIINDSGSEVRSMAKLPDFMQAAASTADGSLIIAGGEDSILRVWDGTNGREITVFK